MTELEELRSWKKQALQVESQWDAQKVGDLLGIGLGQSIRANIEPKIEQLILDREMLLNTLKSIRFLVSEPNCSSIKNMADKAIKFVERG